MFSQGLSRVGEGMPVPTFVPSTADTEFEDLDEALERESLGQLLKNSFTRMRHADGFSHARSMAFQVVFAIIPGLILAVAVAARVGQGRMQSMLRETLTSVTPEAAGGLLLSAVEQGASTAGSGNTLAIIFGGGAAVFAGTEAMASLERGASRIYGIYSDRSPFRHWGLAGLLTMTVGVMLAAAFVLIVFGSSALAGLEEELAQTWAWARWVVGIALLVASLAALFKITPHRDQPQYSWLILGGAIAGLSWLAVSVGLSIFLNLSGTFGETYGPLAGFMGLMIWAELSAVAILFGLAVTAQLEARRAGVSEPIIDTGKATPERSPQAEKSDDRESAALRA